METDMERTKTKTIRFNPTQYRQIKAQASLAGMSIPDWISQCCGVELERQKRQQLAQLKD